MKRPGIVFPDRGERGAATTAIPGVSSGGRGLLPRRNFVNSSSRWRMLSTKTPRRMAS